MRREPSTSIFFFMTSLILKMPGLCIPHPRIAERRFVLEPLNEIAPGFHTSRSRKTIHQLLLECTDELAVKKIEMSCF